MASTARRLATEHTRSLAADVFRYHEHALNAARLSPVALATVQADPLCTPQPNLLREQLARSRENPAGPVPGNSRLESRRLRHRASGVHREYVHFSTSS